nr:hypothetical protein [Tanacetum cinerariifolium]
MTITPDLPTEELEYSLSMRDEHLSTIPKTESNEVIKSSVKNLVPIPSESKVTSDNESECDVPVNDESSIFTTFSNPLFDCIHDFTSSDDKSLSNEVVLMESFKIYSNPLFDDEEIISTKIEEADFDLEEEIRLVENLSYDNSSPRPPEELNAEIADMILPVEDNLDSTPKNVCFVTKSYLLESLLNRDESIPPGIDCDDSDSEGDNLFPERLLHDDPVPLLDTLDFSIDVRVFLPFFTYPLSSIPGNVKTLAKGFYPPSLHFLSFNWESYIQILLTNVLSFGIPNKWLKIYVATLQNIEDDV